MFKELIKAKRIYYGKTGSFPTAVKMSRQKWMELKAEGRAVNMKAAHGLTEYSVTGMVVYIDDTVTGYEFGYHSTDGFNKEVF